MLFPPSPSWTQWPWVWANSGRQWSTGKPVCEFCVVELNLGYLPLVSGGQEAAGGEEILHGRDLLLFGTNYRGSSMCFLINYPRGYFHSFLSGEKENIIIPTSLGTLWNNVNHELFMKTSEWRRVWGRKNCERSGSHRNILITENHWGFKIHMEKSLVL